MSRYYSNPDLADDKWSLPDVEVFYASKGELSFDTDELDESENEAGWYYWYCWPGCLPEGDAMGPFQSEAAAVADMREWAY